MNRDTNLSNINVPGGNPCGQGENMQIPHRKAPGGSRNRALEHLAVRPSAEPLHHRAILREI